MTEDNKKFFENMTYEEWSSNQDRNGLEFKIVQEVHNKYPNWNLGDIKEYTPGFISTHLKIMQDIDKNNQSLSIEDIKRLSLRYTSAGITGDRVHVEVFGSPCSDSDYLAKWNNSLDRIMRIILSPSKYKSEDRRGHSSTSAVRVGDHQYRFRSEMQFNRDFHEIIDHHRDRFPTESDLLRELLFKGLEIYSIVNYGNLGPLAKDILLDTETYRLYHEEQDLRQRLDDIEHQINGRYERFERMTRNRSSKDVMIEFRDDLVRYLDTILTRPCSKQEKDDIKNQIKEDRYLPRILDTLEREKLVSKEYVGSILKDGIPIPTVNMIPTEDTKCNR